MKSYVILRIIAFIAAFIGSIWWFLTGVGASEGGITSLDPWYETPSKFGLVLIVVVCIVIGLSEYLRNKKST
jgi:DMSO/TMAO reductase YedYZ heme-binding membrane subunit